MKKYIALLLFLVSIYAENVPQSFVISREEQAQSVNTLKENVGESLKKAVNTMAELSTKLAEMQLEVATIQKKLLVQGEKLIENKGVYCKASKKDFIKADREIKEMHEVLVKTHDTLALNEKDALTKKYHHITLFIRE